MTNTLTFEQAILKSDLCLITQEKATKKLPVWPSSFQQKHQLDDKIMKLLDDSDLALEDFSFPVSEKIYTQFENEFDGVINETTVVNFASRAFLGMLYFEALAVLQHPSPEAFISSHVMQKMNAFYDLIRMRLDGNSDQNTYTLFKVKTSSKEFAYRCDLKSYCFSLSVDGTTYFISLMDNGTVGEVLNSQYKKLKEHTLHPVQHAEFEAMVYMASYLCDEVPSYTVEQGEIKIVKNPFSKIEVLRSWDNKVLSETLAVLWRPFGIPKKSIFTEPDEVKSYLFDRNLEFTPLEKLEL
ncbi:MAG: hypothetical protein ACJAZ3_000183 [Sphingobacteriales bacterium]|jgi:hypothetical protein